MLNQGTQTAPKVATFNERLNKTMEAISYQCERLESVLSRVNGTSTSGQGRGDVAKISPMLPLGDVVANLEQVKERLANLTTAIEQIA